MIARGKQRTFYKYFTLVLIAFAVPVLGSLFNSFSSPTAYAYCNNLSINYDHQCISENYDSLPGNIKRQYTKDQYVDIVKGCMSGNASGGDFGIRQGGCADAAYTCLQHAVNSKICEDGGDMLATIVKDCNNGKLESNKGEDCDRFKEAQEAEQKKKRDEAIEAAKKGCAIGNTEQEKTRAAEACKGAFNACNDAEPHINDNGTVEGGARATNEFNACIDRVLKETAKNAEDCKSRGGFPVENESGGFRCEDKLGDILNQKDCESAGGIWKGGPSGGQPGIGVCEMNPTLSPSVDPNCPVCSPNTGPLAAPSGSIKKVTSECGEAKVNIISCGGGKGNEAFQNVLKIAAIILSFAVGAAAVGGIAWASVLYAKAEDNEGNVSQAKELIRNVVIGLILYVLLVAVINWLVPGDIF